MDQLPTILALALLAIGFGVAADWVKSSSRPSDHASPQAFRRRSDP